ncbi:MAG: DUF1611 domain-containing protein [Ignavibacteriae bacterium]|nr:DUF1611 domain-containing protein [Ignavibacteria bacterium]MBI3365478.1 DUF1611 domain-containing protein [Ignavibacteriota bacterium]
MPSRRIVILAEGTFSPLESKTANQVIRYIPEQVVAVIDSKQEGRTAQQVLGFGGDIPVVPNLHSALAHAPDTLLIGIAPTGGRLPDEWRHIITEAINNKLDIISGLHTYLSDDKEFSYHASIKNVRLINLRGIPPEYEVVAKGCWKEREARTILTVGTDCNVGKMTASLELHREFLRRGMKSDFVATGQTGILLSGHRGVAVDSVVSDYVAGAIEYEVERSVARGAKYIHVEGQGSLTHQGYSSVTLGLLHGVMPDAMIMVHHPARHADDYGFSLDNVKRLIDLHETMLRPFKESKVIGIAINTVMMTAQQVEVAKRELQEQTALPVADVLTPGVRILADALLEYFQSKP